MINTPAKTIAIATATIVNKNEINIKFLKVLEVCTLYVLEAIIVIIEQITYGKNETNKITEQPLLKFLLLTKIKRSSEIVIKQEVINVINNDAL
jgi:UDP-N-acetylmuramyl pentapeptide phosphotransferase/UDP-N-acetylglucosamine-1-phosphate transferase